MGKGGQKGAIVIKYFVALLTQIHFHDFNSFRKILISLEEVFDLFYP